MPPSPRTVWVMGGYRAGEAQQLEVLAAALGPFTRQLPRYRPHNRGLALLRQAGCALTSPHAVRPPWPDLILSAGFRHEPLVRWLKQQSPSTQTVVVGRPWAACRHFDLVITTPQYRLPPAPNVLVNPLTLAAPVPRDPAPDGAVDALPRPFLTVLLGGPSGNYLFGPAQARDLLAQLAPWQAMRGGSLLVSSSSRTPPEALAALAAGLERQWPNRHRLYRWRPGDAANPYRHFLAGADAVCVTADSVAMTSEALLTQKPVYLFDNAWRGGLFAARRSDELKAAAYRLLTRHGPTRLGRDVDLFHGPWLAQRHLVDLRDMAQHAPQPLVPPPSVLANTIARIHALGN